MIIKVDNKMTLKVGNKMALTGDKKIPKEQADTFI